ncbi:GNAT family N-acetyltransferase [Beijerinckia sp. L45]|uniref:GNAT family N-acetyltransferase n=1 Tax=Beijerinckia sp. L45 TaxID=1641855 RepID=UPI00131EC41E|nr:GNAT family N-acetyltransferase [Beijerinckia sp. L45]
MFPDITCDDIFRLETRRLWLRWVRAPDAPTIASFASLAAVAQMTASIPHPYPAGEAERFILNARAATAGGQALVLGLTLKNKARTLIGLVSAEANAGRDVEIGYVVAPAASGKGLATEAVRAIVDSIFSLTEARTISANSRTINPASRRVLEKSGFAFVDTLLTTLPARGGQHPCDHLKLTRFSWASWERARRMPSMAQQPRDDGGRSMAAQRAS